MFAWSILNYLSILKEYLIALLVHNYLPSEFETCRSKIFWFFWLLMQRLGKIKYFCLCMWFFYSSLIDFGTVSLVCIFSSHDLWYLTELFPLIICILRCRYVSLKWRYQLLNIKKYSLTIQKFIKMHRVWAWPRVTAIA